MISAVVLTKNNQEVINKCLTSLDWVDEIIVIDDFSKDQTVKICQQKAVVFQKKLDQDFSASRNYGLTKAKGDWILFVDSDEVISKDLQKEIQNNIKTNSFNGFYLTRSDKFLGKLLKYGETNSVRLLRLAQKRSGEWSGKVHQVWKVSGKIAVLKNPLIHDRSLSLGQMLERINKYSSLRAIELYKTEVKTNLILIICYPTIKFLQNYFFRLGFLDGIQGLIMAFMMSLHSFMVRSKLWVMQKNFGIEEFKNTDSKPYENS